MNLPLLSFMGTQELLIVMVIVLILFGASKIPALMRGFGQGVGEFKKGLKDGQTEEPKAGTPAAPPAGDTKQP